MLLLKKFQDQGIHPAILLLAMGGVLIHLLFYQNLGFHRDELLYLSLGEHPDFGYFSVPPFIGLLSLAVVKAFGYSLMAVKVIPALTSGVMVYLAALTAREMNGGHFAQILAAVSLICSILFLRAFSLFQPVFLDIFFWTLSFYLITRYIRTNLAKYLYYFGIAAGFGILNKYNIIFLVIALCCVLPFTKYRKLFLAREFYFCILLTLLIVMPNLIWQLVNHLPVMQHLGELRHSQLEKMSAVTFLSEQILMMFPATLIALPGLFYLLFAKDQYRFRLIAYCMILVMMLYILLQGKSYYSAGIYPFLISAGAVFYERYFRGNAARVLIIATLVLLTWMILPMGIGSKSPEKLVVYFDKMAKITNNDAVRRYENNKYHPLPQDYADMLGWDELAAATHNAWLLVDHKDQCIIYAENYGQAGAVTILGKKYNLPEAISFNDNFRYWVPDTFNTEITSLIYINDEQGNDIGMLFENIRETGGVTNPLAREFGTKVYLCTKPKSSFNQFWSRTVHNFSH